ncbi:uncharacterized protein EI90DRAFT_3076975 [Cantharellus anzutake]|uniref:uncharacterized protein n=1 Tax=Cantharellus anzutake TaxID=1750568 RepID=UPI001905065F|nr:uncharacterized protein EI90DRAFT_3076975 [Cantharellus anzutake]KAF8323541.1 hypothetical protein EI90DRAFT_3076975 [Cantharellus anzutake]
MDSCVARSPSPATRMRALSLASTTSSASISTRVSEDATITGSCILDKGKQRSQEDLQFLVISSQLTELSYRISDLQTRIFEIQELRHQDYGSNAVNGASSSSSLSSVIDQALLRLDERLEVIARGIHSVNSLVETRKLGDSFDEGPSSGEAETVDAVLRQKQATVSAEWVSIQADVSNLRDELKEDKWLAVFRNASDQADGMMSSLEKVVNQCDNFVLMVNKHRQNEDNHSQTSSGLSTLSDRYSAFLNLHSELDKALHAKKKYYVPSVSKVLSVLDKGVRDRVTKNGECLRRHADMREKWRSLRDRISTTGADMESVRTYLTDQDFDPSEGSLMSSPSLVPKGTPLTQSRAASSSSIMSRSVSPFRKLAARIARSAQRGLVTPSRNATGPPLPSSEPTLRHRSSLFTLKKTSALDSKHKYSSSAQLSTPSPDYRNETIKQTKPRWNFSTQPNRGSSSLDPKLSDKSRIALTPPHPTRSIHATPRSLSRLSQYTSSKPPVPPRSAFREVSQTVTSLRPLSRQAQPRAESRCGHPRPITPSHIPAPRAATHADPSTGISSPVSSLTPSPNTTPQEKDRKSRRPSLLPVPRGGLRASSPGLDCSISPSPSAINSVSYFASTSEHPDGQSNSLQAPLLTFGSNRAVSRNSLRYGPPSSYRDLPYSMSSRPSSRSSNVNRVFTPGAEPTGLEKYLIGNPRDPLDVEVARVVNSFPHDFFVERVDPHNRTVPSPGEEIKAQYAFSNSLGRKVLACRLLIINRSNPKSIVSHVETRKVMCRVGGGWQDLDVYLRTHR